MVKKKKPMRRIRFYAASVPNFIDYPYILRNIKQKAHTSALHEIVDCGIYDLLKPPYKHSIAKLKQWKALKVRGWKIVPDCPDLLKEFGVLIDFDNVKYSKSLIKLLYDPKDKTQIPVMQAKHQDVSSAVAYCKWFKANYPEPAIIAVGTVCKASNKEKVHEVAREVRKEFPNSWIHIFGLKLNHLDAVLGTVDSFDTASWRIKRGKGGAWISGKESEIQFFVEYVESFKYHVKKKEPNLKNIKKLW